MIRVLVTGAGGIGGVNFIRAIKIARSDIFIVGTDYFKYHLEFINMDKKYKTPRHDSPEFIKVLNRIIETENIEFLHPQPEVEAEVIAKNKHRFKVKTYLPRGEIFDICRDKYLTALKLSNYDLAPKTYLYTEVDNMDDLLEELGGKAWIRVRRGAGGKLSLPVSSSKEVKYWIDLWVTKGRARYEDFIIQEYLPGRDFAWDSLWYYGKLVTSYARERLEYIFPHVSPSRITGTPVVSRIVVDPRINDVAVKAVKAVDGKPHGFYCLDLKEGTNGKIYVTEINLKAHTTLPLWSYIATRIFKMPEWGNIAYLYLKLGLGEEVDLESIPKFDIYPKVTMLRHIDVGVWILYEDKNTKIKVL